MQKITELKKILTIIAVILCTVNLNGQDNCFSKCKENLEKSILPTPEANDQVIQNLIGCKAPDFNVKKNDGESLKLNDLKGKVVVINFWFEACPPCIAELPALNQLREDYEVLKRTLPTWNKSIEQLPFWFRDNYGLEKVRDTFNSNTWTDHEKEQVETMRFWLK